jgi:hypothetical protein
MKAIKMPKCKHGDEPCESQPSYGYRNHKPIRCRRHAESDMVIVTQPKCLVETCKYAAAPKNLYDGYCADCFYDNHPEDLRSRNRKIREGAVVSRIISYIDSKYPTFTDRAHGPSRKRPDLLIVLESFNIILEVDEN